ncbi:MAG: FliA/WhiG family RNA polymerase sigma factor [Deltaproteobacteria bacterium]|nr:FliA/WhiG family RNA polymerase sigma factor [Deltaproteobacteria bacterium]
MTAIIDRKERDKRVMQHAPLVKNIVERIAMRLPRDVSSEDLIHVGIIGLIDALEKYDEKRNVRFETYAKFRIRGAILDELRSRDTMPRSARNKGARLEEAFHVLRERLSVPPTSEDVAEYLGISLDEYYRLLDDAKAVSVLSSDDLPPDYCEGHAGNDLLEKIDQNNPFLLLENRELKRVLVDSINSLPGNERMVLSLYYYEELTLKEVGAIMALTESRICQIHSQAIMRLRGRLQELKPSGLRGIGYDRTWGSCEVSQ